MYTAPSASATSASLRPQSWKAISPISATSAVPTRALAIRVAFVLATPNYQLIHDAIDYDRHADRQRGEQQRGGYPRSAAIHVAGRRSSAQRRSSR